MTGPNAVVTLRKLAANARQAGQRIVIAASWTAAALLLGGSPPASAVCTGCANGSFGPATAVYSSVSHDGLPAALEDFDGDGHLDLVIRGRLNVRLRRGTGTGLLGSESVVLEPSLGIGDEISSVSVGDFNGDGRLDLAVTHQGYDSITVGGVWILLGNGAGGFAPPIETPGGYPYGLTVADFDGDGKLDLAMAGWSAGGATILFGNGDGTFSSTVFLPVVNPGRILVAADFDGDGKPDLSVGRDAYIEPAGAFVFLHTAPRVFGAPTFLPAPGGTQAVADFDNDGRPDLFIQGVMYLNRGVGTFEAPFGPNVFPVNVIVPGDFNGDGRVDLGGAVVYPGDGLGSFGEPIVSSGLPTGMSLAADVNEDGILDLIGGGDFGEISVTLGRGDGAFALTPGFVLTQGAASMERAEFTGDGIPDLVMASNFSGVNILPGLPGGGFGPVINLSSAIAYELVVADFNHDGRKDVAVVTTTGIDIRLGLPGGGLGPPSSLNVGFVSSLSTGDVNGDGHADLAFVQNQASRFVLGNGDGTFGPVIAPSTTFEADHLHLADLNGDGKADLVVYGFPGVSTYIGDGTGNFTLKTTQLVSVDRVLVVDVNGDSRPDVIASPTFLPLKVFLNDGSGGLAPPIDVLPAGNFAGPAAAADFNGDGLIDLALWVDSHVAILIGDGAGHFVESSGYQVFGSWPLTGPILTGDLDGDGRPDLIGVGGQSPSSMLWTLYNTNCVARRLTLTTNVGSCGPAGTDFSPQPSLRVSDDGGNLVSCATGSVSAALVPGTGTPGGTLSGTTTVPVAAGVATFTNLKLDLPGSGYRLRFTHTGGSAVRSRSVTVGPAPPSITVSNACTFGAVRLETPAGAETYRWTIDGVIAGTLPAIAVSGLGAGPHALSLFVTRDGCMTSTSQTLMVSASPSAPAASSNSPVSFGQTLQVTAAMVPEAAYQWTGPGGFSSTLQNPSIPAATPAHSGVYRVAVHVGACSSAETSVPVTVLPAPPCSGCAAASFGPAPRTYPALGASGIVVGDFNGDGISDFAVGGVRVFPGTGNGDFGAPTTTLGATFADVIHAADFDRDGALDIVYFQYASSMFTVQLGHGDGSFEPPVSYSIGAGSLFDLAIGDFNEDGWLDVAAAARDTNRVLIFLGTGTGSLAAPTTIPLAGYPTSIVTGVLRPGVHKDLIVSLGGPNSVAVLLGAGNGTFAPAPSVVLSDFPSLLAIGDLDGDGVQDLAVAEGGLVSVPELLLYHGNSDGTFSLQRTLPMSSANRLRIADLDGDGHADVVFFGWAGLNVLSGKGGWEFNPVRAFGTSDYSHDFDLADFDGDGLLDAAVSSTGSDEAFVAVLRGAPRGFEVAPTAPGYPQGSGAVKGDFNGDGLPDLAFLNSTDSQSEPVSILFNDGLGGFLPPVFLPGTEGAHVAAVDYLDGDSRADLVLPHAGDILVYHGAASGPPVLYQTIPGVAAVSLAIADFNSDSRRDLAVATSAGVLLLPGNGAGGFGGGNPVITLSNISSLQVGDFNGDGKPDLLLIQSFFSQEFVAIGKGDGTFLPPTNVSLPATVSIVAGDVNGDGQDDLVGATPPSGIVVALSNGAGFDPPVTVASPSIHYQSRIAIADLNGDGHADLIVSREEKDLVTIYLADGTGAFLPGKSYLVGRYARDLVVGDFDADGRPELIVFNFYDGNFSILHNTRCVPRRLGLVAPVLTCTPPALTLAPQPVVQVQDDGGNVVSCAEGQVTASIAAGTGTPGAVLGGTKTVAVVNGSATFSNLSIDTAGAAYRLEFHHAVASVTGTAPFSVGTPPAPPVAGNGGPVCVRRHPSTDGVARSRARSIDGPAPTASRPAIAIR